MDSGEEDEDDDDECQKQDQPEPQNKRMTKSMKYNAHELTLFLLFSVAGESLDLASK